MRCDLQAPESHGHLNAQAARQSCGCATRGEFCSIRFLDGPFALCFARDDGLIYVTSSDSSQPNGVPSWNTLPTRVRG